MAQRRFGPTNDAGVVVVEKDSEKTIIPSQLGWVAYAGILEKGLTDELIFASKKKSALKKVGSYVPDSYVPDCMSDFYDLSEGAGGIVFVRITAGNEVESYIRLFDRTDPNDGPRNQVGRLDALSGGGWGGRRETAVIDVAGVPASFTNTTITLPVAYIVETDKWANGTVTVTAANKTYDVVSNTSEDGTGTGAVLTLASDSKLLTDVLGGDREVILRLDNVDQWSQDKHLSAKILDGVLNPTTEWGLVVYEHGDEVLSYEDLSMDPNNERYWVDVINDDENNDYVEAVNLWTGAVAADRRPANHFGAIPPSGVTKKTLTVNPFNVDNSGVAGGSVLSAWSAGSRLIPDQYELTYDGYTLSWILESERWQEFHVFPLVTHGVPYPADNAYSFGFTVSGGVPVHGDTFVIDVLALREDEAVDGRIYPDIDNFRTKFYTVTENTEAVLTIVTGDMTVEAVDGDLYRLEYEQEFAHGYDGIADLTDQDYLDVFDPTSSLFNGIDHSYGLVKFATPGRVSSTVAKRVNEYAYQKNHQSRYEIAANVVTEQSAITYVESTVGRNNYSAVTFPSWCYVPDPVRSGALKLIPNTGMIHGRESRSARDYQGYHKAAAGVDVTFPRIKKLAFTAELDGELLNPKGISRIIKKGGNWVLWGDRIPAADTAWRWKHQREQMSYYEHVMLNNFDWIIFAINDDEENPALISTFQTFFRPEWRPKRALQGDTLDEAASIKIDAENNTPATRSQGDKYADISLWLADTVERFIIQMSKKGLSEIAGS